MRRLSLALALLLLLPIPVRAFNTQDLLSLVEMPLAAAAVSQLSGVSQADLGNVLSNLNQAEVPPNEFVQVVRYVPVALVQQPAPFVQYVQTQTTQGITGPALVTAIDQNLATNYGVTPVVDPNQVVYVDNSYVPDTVLSRLAGNNPLAVALMPLAVAAAADAAGVPQDQLANLVATLNQADVPPQQFVQVVQYAPVALTTTTAPQPFVPFVQTQVAQGITGPALVATIDQRLPQYGVTPSYRLAPQPVAVQPTYVPPTAVARGRGAYEHNPHGGPPGQLKKIEGLQTGAEVVHAERGPMVREHHGNPHGMPPGLAKKMNVPPPMSSAAPPMPMPMPVPQPQPQMEHGHGPPGGMPPGQAKKEDGGDHGHGKGHGKD